MASGERTVRIKFDGTVSGLISAAAKARAELKLLDKQAEQNKKNLAKFGEGLGNGLTNITKSAAGLANKLAGVATVLNVLPTLTAGVIALSGSLGLLVGAGVAFAAISGTMKLGADGIKQAFSQLTPVTTKLKAEISKSFVESLTPAMNNLKTVIPQLTSGFKQIATAIGGAATKFTIMLKTNAATTQMKQILSDVARVVQNLGKALAPIGAAFLRIASVAMPLLVQLTGGIGAAAEKFNAWVQAMADNGNLKQWMETAIGAFKQIFHVIGQLGDIIFTVISTLADAGLGISGVFGPVIDQVQAFVNSAEGHNTIIALAQAIASIGQAVGQVLGAALKAIAPALPGLLSFFQKLVTTATPVLVSVITALGKAFQALAGFVEANQGWLAPLVITLGSLAAIVVVIIEAWKAYQAIVIAVTVVQWLWNAAMDANPIGIVVLAIVALIAIIVLVIENLDFFRGIWDAVWKWCSDRITDVVNWFKSSWDLAVQVFETMLSIIRGRWDEIWAWVSDRITDVVNFFRDRWDWAVGVFNGAVGAIKSAWSSVGTFISGVFDGIVGGIRSAINSVIRIVNGAISGVNSATGLVGIPAIPHIPMLARGGTARAGQPHIVGENGPELFIPGQTGRVTSNEQSFGGPSTVEIHIEVGGEVVRVVRQEIDESNRSIARTVTSRPGGALR